MIVDLFAGPGGWDEGLAWLGRRDVVGVEWDASACATAEAAGHARIHADVSKLDPVALVAASTRPPWTPHVEGLIASPPCQAWSAAGKRLGELDRVNCHTLADRMASGDDTTDWCDWHDARSPLIAQPVRWVRDLTPDWIALEEVPAVADYWRHLATIFTGWGYRVWTGVVNAADYGVPQTRKRAILLAHRSRRVARPHPTHSRTPSLFEAPWATMFEALGLGFDAPSATVSGGGTDTGGAEVFGNADYRRRLAAIGFPRRDETDPTRYRERDLFPIDGPAPTVTEKARSWKHFHGELREDERPPVFVSGNQENSTRRSIDEPAPTLLFGHRKNDVRWLLDGRTNSTDGKGGTYPTPPVSSDRPGPTVTTNARLWTWAEDAEWAHDRPATAVMGDPRLAPPGHRDRSPDGPPMFAESVRVTVEQAAALQSFPRDYPWQGTKTRKFRQIGDAVPPLLAARMLESLGVGSLS